MSPNWPAPSVNAPETTRPIRVNAYTRKAALKAMGFRFYRRVRLAPGLSINLSRSGPSLTMGVRGAHVTVGRRGVTRTIGLPGTGLFYTSRRSLHSGYHSAASRTLVTPEQRRANAWSVERVFLLLLAALVALVPLAYVAASLASLASH